MEMLTIAVSGTCSPETCEAIRNAISSLGSVGGHTLSLAGWPEDREVWTGSCPCQPFSVAGKRKGTEDERHLWPEFYRLISKRKPAVVFGEQVARAIGFSWLDTVANDLEGKGYAVGAAVLPACAVGAPHQRDRLWFVADTDVDTRKQRRANHAEQGARGRDIDRSGLSENVADSHGAGSSASRKKVTSGTRQGAEGADVGQRSGVLSDASGAELRQQSGRSRRKNWQGATFAGEYGAAQSLANADVLGTSKERQQRGGEQRRSSGDPEASDSGGLPSWPAEPNLPRMAHGVRARVGKLRGLGNAIVPQVAAEFIKAYTECRP